MPNPCCSEARKEFNEKIERMTRELEAAFERIREYETDNKPNS